MAGDEGRAWGLQSNVRCPVQRDQGCQAPAAQQARNGTAGSILAPGHTIRLWRLFANIFGLREINSSGIRVSIASARCAQGNQTHGASLPATPAALFSTSPLRIACLAGVHVPQRNTQSTPPSHVRPHRQSHPSSLNPHLSFASPQLRRQGLGLGLVDVADARMQMQPSDKLLMRPWPAWSTCRDPPATLQSLWSGRCR